jgi:hypothetical protein
MIYFPLSKFVDSAETVVAPGAVITAEGQALVRAPGAPAAGVTPSMAADDTEIFAGFAVAGVSAAPLPLLYASKVEEFVVPGSGVVSLAFAPVAGQLFAYNITAGAAIAAPTVTGNKVTGLPAGNTVRVTYKYALSAVQARNLQGDVQPGGYAGEYVGQVGLIKRGLIYTSQFDAAVNWAAATEIKLAVNGMITDQTGDGAAIKGYVVALPNVETPYLGIEFSAA